METRPSMESKQETVQVISALELVYQLLRRFYTGCTEWDNVTSTELGGEIRRRVFAADALLGKSTEEPSSDSDAMKSYNSAIHWQAAYDELMADVLRLALNGTNAFSELRCPTKYKRKQLKKPEQVFFLADSAARWAKKHRNMDIPEDADIRFLPISERESKSSLTYDEGELAYRTLAELTRQLLTRHDVNWRPGKAQQRKTTNLHYHGGNLNLKYLSEVVAEALPKNVNGKEPNKVIWNNFKYVKPLVEGDMNSLTAPSKDALAGMYRTIYGLALVVDKKLDSKDGNKKIQTNQQDGSPEAVIGNLTSPPLLGSELFRKGLTIAADKRLK